VLRRVEAHARRARGKPARWYALALASSSVAAYDDKQADCGDASNGAYMAEQRVSSWRDVNDRD